MNEFKYGDKVIILVGPAKGTEGTVRAVGYANCYGTLHVVAGLVGYLLKYSEVHLITEADFA